MNVEILAYDKANAIADIRFTQNGFIHEETYDLGLVVPGTRITCQKLNVPFDMNMQSNVISKLTEWMQIKMESVNFQTHLEGDSSYKSTTMNTEYPI